jgi:succinate dehydrogenase / fumarate reductase cytochrome b subunit
LEKALESRESAKTAQPSYDTTPGARHFWIRRLHSLTGLVFGGYIAVHLIVNATGLWPKVYQQNVDKIHNLEPMLPLIELAAIFIPLLIHALYGIYITKAGVKFNTTKYQYGGNLRYTLQRWTAVFLLLFIIYHVGTLHKWGFTLIGLQSAPDFNPKNMAYQTTAGAIKTPYQSAALNFAVSAFYLLGVWSAVFHLANGLWTSAIAWGLTVSRNSQRRWGHVCVALGIGLGLVGTTAWFAFGPLGRPELDIEETRTMSDEAAEEVHGQATGGKDTNRHVPSGQDPAGIHSASSGAPTTRPAGH